MVKHRGGRRKRGAHGRHFAVIKAEQSLPLSNIAAGAISTAAGPTLTQDFEVISTDMLVSYEDHTAGEGPIEFGLAQAELSGTEIQEAVDAQPTSESDIPAIEHARRKVRTYGYLSGAQISEVANDGKHIRKKMYVNVPAGKAMPDLWVINRSISLFTTGTVVKAHIKYYGFWK